MDYSEKWGDSIEAAVKLALIDLKLTEDQVTVTVLEEPSKGFFGIGSKLAKVRVEKKPEMVEIKEEPKVEEPTPQPMSGNVIRDRLPDSRIWGAVLKSLRANSQIMLWIACQELDTKIEDQTLTILVDGENEYNLLKKPESMEILQETLQRHAPYKLVLKRVGAVETEDDKIQRDAAEVNKRFGNKLEIK